MYDFGFYLEHSPYFKEYLKDKFKNGTQIKELSDFDEFVEEFSKTQTFENYFKDIKFVNGCLVAYGIRFDKVCDVELDTKFEVLPDNRFGDHHRFVNATKEAAKGKKGGTYIWCFDEEAKYVGEADDLVKRIKDYSDISTYAVENNEQTTNRHMNAEIVKAIKKGKKVTLYFYPTENHHDDVELYLLENDQYNHFTLNKKDAKRKKR